VEARVKRGILVGILALAAIAAGIAITILVVDIHEDRQYKVKITGKVQVYDAESPSGYTRGDEGVIETLHPQDQVDVMRIVSHDDFQAIKIRLHDGREGYIFCCENFEFSK
jgi:threonine dehydrogenase-like Zn-dependent dehydrogenase